MILTVEELSVMTESEEKMNISLQTIINSLLQMINIMILKQVKEEKSLKPSWKWKIKIGERP